MSSPFVDKDGAGIVETASIQSLGHNINMVAATDLDSECLSRVSNIECRVSRSLASGALRTENT